MILLRDVNISRRIDAAAVVSHHHLRRRHLKQKLLRKARTGGRRRGGSRRVHRRRREQCMVVMSRINVDAPSERRRDRMVVLPFVGRDHRRRVFK